MKRTTKTPTEPGYYWMVIKNNYSLNSWEGKSIKRAFPARIVQIFYPEGDDILHIGWFGTYNERLDLWVKEQKAFSSDEYATYWFGPITEPKEI